MKRQLYGFGVLFWVIVAIFSWAPLAFANEFNSASCSTSANVVTCSMNFQAVPTTNYVTAVVFDGTNYFYLTPFKSSPVNSTTYTFSYTNTGPATTLTTYYNYLCTTTNTATCTQDADLTAFSGNFPLSLEAGPKVFSGPDGSEVFPGIATSSSTTISFQIVDNPNLDLALGMLFFLSGVYLMMWLFKRK